MTNLGNSQIATKLQHEDNEVLINSSDIAKGSSPIPFDRESMIALFSLLEALSYEVMSKDIWWLANSHAREIATTKYGISEEVYDQVMEKFDEARKAKGAKNPMSSMF